MNASSSANESVAPTPSSGNQIPTPNSNTQPNPTTTTSARTKSRVDPAWGYVEAQKEGETTVFRCLKCGKSFRGGGIHRMKEHLAGKKGNVTACKKVDHDTREMFAAALNAKKKATEVEDVREDVEETNVEAQAPSSDVDSSLKRKAPGALDKFFASRTTKGDQPSLKSVLVTKEARHKVKMLIAEWAIVNCIPFRAIECPLFQKAIDGMCAIGPGFRAPSAYDFKTNLLSEWKAECQLIVDSHKAKWKNSGCTLMADGWTDVRQRTLINFLVYSSHGLVFVKSVDASDVVKDAKTLFTLFCDVIEWVGPKNIVHVVTDNAANYVACGRLIKEKYRNIYWSPCAAHCLNLALKDIASLSNVSAIVSKASKITVFAYNHMVFLSWLRKRKDWKEIVRPGATRFATAFITLHSIYMHKHDLQALVFDKHFVDHRLCKPP